MARLILIAGGLFLVWKATTEIHHNVDSHDEEDVFDTSPVALGLGAAIAQIIMLDLVFSIDSIVTAVGMTEHVPIMFVAVIVAVSLMLTASGPLSRFIDRNPTVVMLALAFLFMIGMSLIADGFGVQCPRAISMPRWPFRRWSRGSTSSRGGGARRGRAPPARRRALSPAAKAARRRRWPSISTKKTCRRGCSLPVPRLPSIPRRWG